jgi:hypothetical protein
MKSNATVLMGGIITFGREAHAKIEGLPPEKQNEIFKNIVGKISQELETDLESLVVHRDESSIHCHFSLLGYDRNGKPISQKLSPKTCSELQDLAAKSLPQHLGITRGKRKIDRIRDGEPAKKISHRTVRELHLDLENDIEEARKIREELEKEMKIVRTLKRIYQPRRTYEHHRHRDYQRFHDLYHRSTRPDLGRDLEDEIRMDRGWEWGIHPPLSGQIRSLERGGR